MPESYIEKVKIMHESGGHGSQGLELILQLIFYTIQFILCNLTNIPLALKSTRDRCATQKCSSKDTGKATALIGRMTTVFT